MPALKIVRHLAIPGRWDSMHYAVVVSPFATTTVGAADEVVIRPKPAHTISSETYSILFLPSSHNFHLK